MQLNPQTVERVTADALAEDLSANDITSRAVIPTTGTRFAGILSAREPLVVARLELAGREGLARLAPDVVWEPLAAESNLCPAGTMLARLEGPAR